MVTCKKCLKCGLMVDGFVEGACPACGNARFSTGEYPIPVPYRTTVASRLTPKGKKTYVDACKGIAKAMYDYGDMLRSGCEGSAAGAQEAYAWFLAAGAAGYPDGYYRAGLMQNNRELTWTSLGGTPEEAAPILKLGAEKGSVPCMSLLGKYYLTGRGVRPNDILAHRYLSDAAARGDAEAMLCMAQCHLEGSHGFEHDAEKAKALYRKSGMLYRMYADFRNAYAMGKGLPKDPAKAAEMGEKYLGELMRLYCTAPQEIKTYGYACMIGDECLSRGQTETAVVWYREAMKGGDVMGRVKLQNLGRL